jgi:hypothetical protein
MVFIYKPARHDEHYDYLQSIIISIIYCKLDGWNGSNDVSSNSTNCFPAIVPIVLLYYKLVSNEQSISSVETLEAKFPTLKVILFVGMYLAIWALTGLGLLLALSIPMNNIVMPNDV